MCEALKGRPRRCWGLQSKATNDRGLGFFTATSRLTGYYFINLASVAIIPQHRSRYSSGKPRAVGRGKSTFMGFTDEGLL